MSKPAYSKPHHSYEQQIDKMLSRGMVINDREAAMHILQHVNYYRLGIYWHSFETDHKTHQLRAGTRFDDVVGLYEFDRKLRLLVLDGIERIEISMRAQWAYHMSAAYGAHAHLNDNAHNRSYLPKSKGPREKPRDLWQENMESLAKELERSDEIFIRRQLDKYSNHTPSIWAVSEVMSFGLLSKWYRSLRVSSVRKNIARMYRVHPDILESWMQHFTVVRNNCAHHSRLWNRHFNRVAPILPKHHPAFNALPFVPGYPLANSILILLYLLDIISPGNDWRQRFCDLAATYPTVPLKDMGFPDNWRTQPIWQQRGAP